MEIVIMQEMQIVELIYTMGKSNAIELLLWCNENNAIVVNRF